MSGEVIPFPVIVKEPLEPISELIAVKPELWFRLIGSKIVADNVILSNN